MIKNDPTDDSNKTYYAFSMGVHGVYIFSYPREEIGDEKFPELKSPNYQKLSVVNSKVSKLFKAASLEGDDGDQAEPFFYAISSKPPSVVEFDMSDVENVILSKIYSIDSPYDSYIGTMSIAVNAQYILHLLYDPDSGAQIIRVFCRNQTLDSAALFERDIYTAAPADFFQFPNVFFNFLVSRDERTVNITAIVDASISLNGSSPAVEDYKNQPFKVDLRVVFGDFVLFKDFNVTFLDRYNTSITAVGNDSITDIELFYNCGEPTLDYIVSDLLNGPNYNLTQVDTSNHTGFFKFEN